MIRFFVVLIIFFNLSLMHVFEKFRLTAQCFFLRNSPLPKIVTFSLTQKKNLLGKCHYLGCHHYESLQYFEFLKSGLDNFDSKASGSSGIGHFEILSQRVRKTDNFLK